MFYSRQTLDRTALLRPYGAAQNSAIPPLRAVYRLTKRRKLPPLSLHDRQS